jgi:hypothetical protein
VAIAALHGLRGIGKTTLAAAYAERHRANYRATWWIRAQTEPTMRADLTALGVRLGWVAADKQEEPALAAVAERLRHEGDDILLIFDNATDADALKPHLPSGGAARVLVTSNSHAWRRTAKIASRVLRQVDGSEDLRARNRRGRQAASGREAADRRARAVRVINHGNEDTSSLAKIRRCGIRAPTNDEDKGNVR